MRTDNAQFRFTEHSAKIRFESQDYTPALGLSASALSQSSGLQEASQEFVGVIDSTEVTTQDIRLHRFDDALVFQYVVDWSIPWVGALRTDKFRLGPVEWDGEKWRADVLGLETLLDDDVGEILNCTCGYDLFDLDCAVARTSGNTKSGLTVTSVVDRFTFRTGTSQLGSQLDDYWNLGKVTFNSGVNEGFSFEVADYTDSNREFTLVRPAPFDIVTGVFFTLELGCNKLAGITSTVGDCKNLHNNLDRFGGEPFTPGTDKLLQRPTS